MSIHNPLNVIDIIQPILIIPVVLVSLLYPYRLNTKTAILIITPVVLFSFYLLLQHQAPDLMLLPLALIGGFLLFIVSIWITQDENIINSLKKYSYNIQNFFQVDFKKLQDWNSIFFISAMVIYEELVWRVFLVETLTLYINGILVIAIASFLFYYSHPNQRNLSRQSADLFIFSLTLTTTYLFTKSFILVILIHWIRNMIIVANSIGSNE